VTGSKPCDVDPPRGRYLVGRVRVHSASSAPPERGYFFSSCSTSIHSSYSVYSVAFRFICRSISIYCLAITFIYTAS
jgi:hypothetical protein